MVIAFLLSTLLILAYQMFYYMPRTREIEARKKAEQALLDSQKPPVDPSAAGRDGQPQGDAGDRSRVADGDTRTGLPADSLVAAPDLGTTNVGGFTAANAAAQKTVSVITPFYDITFSSTGGEIVSARLLKYETLKEPVELVAERPGDLGIMRLRLIGERESTALSGIAFEPFVGGRELSSGSKLTLDETSGEKTLTFRAETPDGGTVERTYTFLPDSYKIRAGVRFPGALFAFARHIEWGMGPGLRATETNVAEDEAAMRATARIGDEVYRKKRGDFQEQHEGVVQWTALQTKYFTAVLLPNEPTGGEVALTGAKDDNFMTTALRLPAVERQGQVNQALDLYLGPVDYGMLKTVGRGLQENVDMGWSVFRPLARGVLWCTKAMYKFIPNYGVVIILLSVLTKILFYRLTHKSFKSMADMQALQPRLQGLKEKYKDDRQKLSAETMKLYKESGVNPIGGCLPMVLQMPVFVALYAVFRNMIDLRRAPFFGWIDDLSQQDVLFSLPASLPLIGSAFSVLPILMGAGMFFQSKIGGGMAGPGSSATQPKAMLYMMPIVMTFLFYKMPSGLVLYWLVNTVMSVAQQYYINKGAKKNKIETDDDATPDIEPPKIAQKPKQRQKQRKARAKKG